MMEDAEEVIRSSDLPLPLPEKDLLAALIPRVGLSSYSWIPRALPLGASRFGGPADLPVGMDWPHIDGRLLLLMAQLNFGTLRIERSHPLLQRLPERGCLCLFLDCHNMAHGMAGENPGIIAMQFDEADKLIRHEPEPASDAEIWTSCHAVTVCYADQILCLPDAASVDSPLPKGVSEENRKAYEHLKCEFERTARTRFEVSLLGSPTLYNPDLRHDQSDPSQWMLLLEFKGDCGWFAGNTNKGYVRPPMLGDVDYVQYFVRKSDYDAGRLDRGFLDYMMT